MTSPDRIVEPEMMSGRSTRRRALGAMASGGIAASIATIIPRDALAQDSQLLGKDNTSPFSYRLSQSDPQVYEGGVLRTATVENIPALSGLSINLIEIHPGATREIHWHPNAGEINYCLEGEGTIGVLSTTGESATIAISPGTITFMPIGDAHYIRNTASATLRLLIGFSNENAEHQTFSEVLPWVPADLLNQTLGVPAGTLPLLPPRGDLAIVSIGDDSTETASADPSPFSTQVENLVVQKFAGGTVQPLRVDVVPRLEGMTLLKLDINVDSIREPHWHGNASEFNYCASGTAQIGIVSPSGESWTVTLDAGDVAYIPKNWFHYIAGVGDEPVVILAFFDAVAPNRIDLTTMTNWFPAEVLAASFGIDPEVFATLPKNGTAVIAGPLEEDGERASATPSA
jgi:oxalate decarboxylase